ncbi:MAG: hypothetical protein K2Q22_13755, partial [Cytophagales bacterium]|nr:hypothetical protein [Cytophagales bacterium]
DHVLVIHQGELIEQGSPKEVYYHPKHISTARLTGVCNLIPPNSAIQKLGFPKFEEGCLVRPDQIVICKSQVPHSLLAIVEKIEFCGFFQNIHMLLEESQSEIIAVQMTNLTDLSVGDKVWAEFKS